MRVVPPFLELILSLRILLRERFSDIDGNFTLQAPVGQVLIIRMVGMETTRATVSKTGTLQVTLKEATSFLNEIVITGFQEVDRKLFYWCLRKCENGRYSD